MLPKILIASPTNIVKDYCFISWLMHVRQIDYPKYQYDIMMVDNSRENGYDKYLTSWGIVSRHINPKNKDSREFICESHNVIREYFLWNDYDYLLHLESDVMINSQTLRTLIFHAQQNDLPVVSASYFHGEHADTKLILGAMELYGIKRQVIGLGFKDCVNLSNKFFKVFMNGLGCTLIRRDVFDNIKFRFMPNEDIYPDSFFYQDLFEQKIPAYIDTSLILEHHSQNWGNNLDHSAYRNKNKK